MSILVEYLDKECVLSRSLASTALHWQSEYSNLRVHTTNAPQACPDAHERCRKVVVMSTKSGLHIRYTAFISQHLPSCLLESLPDCNHPTEPQKALKAPAAACATPNSTMFSRVAVHCIYYSQKHHSWAPPINSTSQQRSRAHCL